jgi:hypothetical protein
VAPAPMTQTSNGCDSISRSASGRGFMWDLD